ncbi:MAG: aminotransferase class IV [Acidobacteriota bacterium]|nr:aminotransferase class IV [Acidobacteriota bacterium]
MIGIMINGSFVPAERAVISVLDHGFLYGDSVYEVVKTRGGVLFAALPHLHRLRYSAGKVGIPITSSDEFLLDELERMVEAVESEEVYLRMVITRGEGDFGLSPEGCRNPSRIIYGKPFQPLAPDLYTNGVTICSLEPERDDRGNIKSGVNLSNIRAVKEARRRGAHEALRLSENGCIAECATSNIFWVKKGKLYTPAIRTGILKGVTRQLVLHLANDSDMPVNEGMYPMMDLHTADEVFITSTTRDILPVSQIDNQVYGVGPVTRELGRKFQEIGEKNIQLF